MTLSDRIKPKVDLPIWELLRFPPQSTLSGYMALCTSKSGLHPYIYINTISTQSIMHRYNVEYDGWSGYMLAGASGQTISSSSIPGTAFFSQWGYMFRATAATSNTVSGALLSGGRLDGVVIRIVEGTGAGQERTITSVTDPVVADRGTITSSSTASLTTHSITDSNKSWTPNQWVGYQVRFSANSSSSSPIVRRVLYNNATTLFFFDQAWSSHSALEWGVPLAGSQLGTRYWIETATATVNTAWAVQPDITSHIVTETGLAFYVTAESTNNSTTRYYNHAYDPIADAFVHQQTSSGFIQNFSTQEPNIASMDQWGPAYYSGTATGSSTTTSLAAGGSPGWTTNRWRNYMVLITGGTGSGQRRIIASNTSAAVVPLRPFSVSPDATSTFTITADDDKMYAQQGSLRKLFQFSIRSQWWTPGRQLDFGVVRSISALRGSGENPLEAFAVSGITRSGTTATVTTTLNHNLRVNDSVTIAGATGADATLYNGTFTITTVPSTTTFTYTMTGTPTATATFTAPTTTTLVDVTKNWTVNELVNKVLIYQTPAKDGAITANVVITANTANTLTFATSTAPSAGNHYVIHDAEGFGFDNWTGSAATNGVGVSTSGGASTLTDTTKSWVTNEHANKMLIFTGGAAASNMTSEYTITSNTANTLTISGSFSSTPGAAHAYTILPIDALPVGSGALQFAAYPTVVDQGKYLYSQRRYGMYRYDITSQQWEPLSTSGYAPSSTESGWVITYDGKNRLYMMIASASTGMLYKLYMYDMEKNDAIPFAQALPTTGGTALGGQKMEIITTPDGSKYLYALLSGPYFYRVLLPS